MIDYVASIIKNNAHRTLPYTKAKYRTRIKYILRENIMNREIFTEKEAAIYIGMSRSFLSQDRMNGYREGRTPGPTFMKLGRSVRYRKDDLDEWLNMHRMVRTAV